MRLKIRCTCKKVLIVPEELMGKRVKCPACGEKLTIASAQALRDSGVFKAIPKTDVVQAGPATPPPIAPPSAQPQAAPKPAAKPATSAPKPAAKPAPKPAVTPPPQKAAPAPKPAAPTPSPAPSALETLSLEDAPPSTTPPSAPPEPPAEAPPAPAKIKPVEPAKVTPQEPPKAPTAALKQEEALFSLVDEQAGQPAASFEGVLVDESAPTAAQPPAQPAEAPKAAEATEEAAQCPNCKEPVEKGAVLCVKCGTNLKTGEKMGAAKGEPAKPKKGLFGWLKRGRKAEAPKAEEAKPAEGEKAEDGEEKEEAEAPSSAPAKPAQAKDTPPPTGAPAKIKIKPVSPAKAAPAAPPKPPVTPAAQEEELVLEDHKADEPRAAASILAGESGPKEEKEASGAAKETAKCPHCNEAIDKGSVICIKCGTNLKTGEKLGAAKTEPAKAKKGLFGWLKRGKKEEAPKAEEAKSDEEAEGEESQPAAASEEGTAQPKPAKAPAAQPAVKKPVEAAKPAARKPVAAPVAKAPVGKKAPEKPPVAKPEAKKPPVKPTPPPKPPEPPKEMVNCPHCNEQIEKGSVICVKCGTNLKTGQKLGAAPATEPAKAKGGMMSWLKKGKGK